MKRKLDNKFNTLYKSIDLAFVSPLKEAKQNIKALYSKDRKKAILVILGFAVALFLSLLISYYLLKEPPKPIEQSSLEVQSEGIATGEDAGSGEKTVVTVFLESYKGALDFFTPVFDSFISQTADPTGKSVPSGNGYSIMTWGNEDTQFITDQKVRPALYYSRKLLGIVTPLLVLLIGIQGFNMMRNPETAGSQKEFALRIITTLGFLILTPYILSLSIMFMNLLSREITDGQPLTEFMTTFINAVEKEYEANPGDFVKTFLGGLITGQTSTAISLVQSLPVIVPMILILILFLYVSFQFILRFLNLYFLTAIYPFAVVFHINRGTQNIPISYWKQWTTFLIHQPVFVLGYAIVQDLLNDMLQSKGVGFEQILIFLGFLLFLASINMLSARIWGDVYTAVSTNIQSAIGAKFTKDNLIDKPKQKATSTASDFGKGVVGIQPYNATQLAGQKFGNKIGLGSNSSMIHKGSTNSKGGTKVQHTALKDGTQSYYAKDLGKKGYEINGADAGEGTLNMGGQFYAHKDDKSGISTLYTSEDDYKADGLTSKDVEQVNLNNLKMRDPMNKQANQDYNRVVGQYAKDKGFKGKTHIKATANDNWVKSNMKFGKGINSAGGVDGIITKHLPKNAPPNAKEDPNNFIFKMYVYNDSLKDKS